MIAILEVTFVILIVWAMFDLVNDRKHPEKVIKGNEKWNIMIAIGKKKYLLQNRFLKYGLLMAIFSPPLEGKMLIIIEGIFIALIIMLPISLVFGRENSEIVKEGNKNISINSNNTKFTIIIMVCINFVCHVIDYLLNTDMISAVTYHKNGGMTISFVGIFILIVASILVSGVTIKYLEKKKNQ